MSDKKPKAGARASSLGFVFAKRVPAFAGTMLFRFWFLIEMGVTIPLL